MKRSVGIDMGGTWIRVALGTEDGVILKKITAPVDPLADNASILNQLETLIIEVSGDSLKEIKGIGIAAAGKLDIKRSTIIFSPHTSIRSLSVEPLHESLKKPLTFLNDGVAAALAELRLGAGRGHDNIVYVGIGTGIGGGIVVDGHLLIGKEGNAHEMGHMIIDAGGAIECDCGGRGHWEAYTSGSGLPRLSRLLAQSFVGRTPFLERSLRAKVEAREVFEYARKGDNFALSVVREATRLNAIAMANLVNLYDPSLISVGGGVAIKNVDFVVSPLQSYVERFSFNTPPKIVPSPLGEEAPLLGSVVSVFGLDFNI
ncbi:MAG: ROK family protein [Candidatus Methanomethyliaceae archaeon]|nr:ROK family protein [Candidatus Methanomethyliaceae archaeon]